MICEDCYNCACFVNNSDTGNECMGEEKPCHEFREWGDE